MDYEERCRNEQKILKSRLKEMRKRIREIAPELVMMGCPRVTVEYNGSGDDGNIETPEFVFNEGEILPEPLDDKKLDAYSEIFTQYMDLNLTPTVGDWYNNSGGFGIVTFNLVTGAITFDHSVRIETTEDETYSDVFRPRSKRKKKSQA